MNPKANIVSAIKALGYNQRQVSVRDTGGSMSWGFDVTVRDPKVNIEAVENAVKSHESYERDPGGDILSGGNTFIFVGITDEVRDAIAAPFVEAAEAAVVALEAAGEGRGVEVIPGYHLFKYKNYMHMSYHPADRSWGGRIGGDYIQSAFGVAFLIGENERKIKA